MKKIILALLLLLIAVTSCKEKQKPGFSLSGKTKEIKNGTILFLIDPETKQTIDSTSVENNLFTFNTKLSSTSLKSVLCTKDYSKLKYIWLEDNQMTFDASSTDFKNAVITGSETENKNFELQQLIKDIKQPERQEIEKEFVKNNPTSPVSAHVLRIYSAHWGKEKTTELFNNFSNDVKNSIDGKNIQKYISLNKNPVVGEKYVDFEMKDTTGVVRKLSEIKGEAILLEFWASWCGPCRKENPNLLKIYKQFNPKGFEIFAVSLDDNKTSWLKAINKDGLPWNHVSELNGGGNSAALIYGVTEIPNNFLIDKDGTIIARNIHAKELNKKLQEIIPTTNNVSK